MRNVCKRGLYPLLLVLLCATVARAEQVTLPLTLDHKLLTSLLAREAFPGKNRSASLVGRPGDCTYIGISDPKFTTAGQNLRLEMRLVIRLGTELGRECLVPVEWQGYIALLQQPVFDSRRFSLSFRTQDVSVYNQNRQPVSIANMLWEFAKPRVIEHLNRVRLDLAPPVDDLRAFLAPLFHAEARQTTQAMLDSLRGGPLTIGREGMLIELQAEVEEVYVPDDPAEKRELTLTERSQLIRLWETWDVFLVQMITLVATDSLTPEDRLVLVDVLLDARYVFAEALARQDLSKDFVRAQFVRAWRDLGPVFRRQLINRPTDNTLGYLAFFTAADALLVFDRMGPTLGIEISQQGLLRLATMLTGEATTLPYSSDVDERLRNLLQLPPGDSQKKMDNDLQEIDLPPESEGRDPLTRLADFFITPAYSAEIRPYSEILEWRVPEDNFTEYVEKIRGVLDEASAKVMTKQQFPEKIQPMFKSMIVATAWQESCFRQFVVKGKKLTYLLSSNQSSVGVMQINERVWRGIYDLSQLRWDIRYNALAGCEIVDLYMRRYALKEKGAAQGIESGRLAKSIYAMYNGGPAQYEKYLERVRTGHTYPSDQMFAEKLRWVEKRDWAQISECLGDG